MVKMQGLMIVRRHLLRSLAVTGLVTLALLPLARPLFTRFMQPLWQHLPTNSQLIAVDVFSGFWVPVELSMLLALFITLPWWLLECWWWIAPGLYRSERRLLKGILCAGMLLFVVGVSFAYLFVLPLMIHFLVVMAPTKLSLMPDVVIYLAFSVRLLVCFGVLFELPLVMVSLVYLQWIERERLKRWRRYVLVGAFIIGMLVAPDPLSQCLIALPLYALYELGLCLTLKTNY